MFTCMLIKSNRKKPEGFSWKCYDYLGWGLVFDSININKSVYILYIPYISKRVLKVD